MEEKPRIEVKPPIADIPGAIRGPFEIEEVGEDASAVYYVLDGMRRRVARIEPWVLYSQELARTFAAGANCMVPLVDAAGTAKLEIEQFHSTAYPKCEGGCPAHEALDKLKAAIELARTPIGMFLTSGKPA